MKKFIKYAILVVILLLFVGTFYFLYQKSTSKEQTFTTFTVQRGDITKNTILTGTIEPRDEVLIKPQISGIISELYKTAGEMVKQGEVIAKVKVIPDMGALNSAQSRVSLAQINSAQIRREYDRTSHLYNDKLVSQEEYEKGKQALQQAQEELKAAQDALQIVKEGVSKSTSQYSTTLIRSTIDGLILDIPIKVGNSVIMSNSFNDGTTIASVADMRKLIFKGFVDETEVARVQVGMPVKIIVGALAGKSFDAKIEYVAPKVTSAAGNANQFEVKAALQIPQDVVIRAGYSANAEITLEQVKQVLTVPEAAVKYENDSTFVYVLTSKAPQTFTKTPVKTGMSDGVHIQLISGVKAGTILQGNPIVTMPEEDNDAPSRHGKHGNQ